MTIDQFLTIMNSGERITAGSETHEMMHRLSQEAIRITMDLNTNYHTPKEIVALMSELTGVQVHDSFGMFPHFTLTAERIFAWASVCSSTPVANFRIMEGSQSATMCLLATTV